MEARSILDSLARATDCNTHAIRYGRRVHPLVFVRHVAHWLIRNLTGSSYPEVGRAMSGDHSTSIYACRKVEEDIANGGPRLDILLAFIGYASRLP